MNKEKFDKAVDNCFAETREALQTVYNELNNGQQKKLLKSDAVKVIFDRYGVEY